MNRARVVVVTCALATLLAAAGCGGRPAEVDRVIVITLDTTRADRLGFHGYEGADTPNLDALAADSVVFDEAVSPIPTTLPAHSSMFTGLYPPDHGVRYNLTFRLGPEADTLAERLQAAGFATAGFPASFVVGGEYGLNQGFDHYAEPPGAGGGGHSFETSRSAEEGVDLALDWLDARAPDERSFVWLHLYDPHWPYRPKFPFSSTFAERPYDGELAYVDRQIGRLLDALAADSQASRTAVIVLGDHGEGLYEHREPFHASLVYQTTQHVPFLIHVPGATARRVAEPVTIADLMPTVLDLAGVPAPHGLRGISLTGTLRGESPPARDLYMESHAGALNYGWAELTAVRAGRYKLIEDGSEVELYDVLDDPGELVNLASLEGERVADLRAGLAEILASAAGENAAESAHDAVLDPETERMLASLGYVGGAVGGSADDAVHPKDVIDLEAELLAAQTSISRGDWARLEDICRYVLERDPKNRFALTNLAQALVRTDRPREAQDVAAEFVRVYPTFPGAYARLAETYRAQGQIETAHRVLQRGMDATAAAGTERGSLKYYSALTAYELDAAAACRGEVAEALGATTVGIPILVLGARCALDRGDEDEAIVMLRSAAKAGFRAFEALAGDSEFAELAATAAFRELAAEATAQDAP